MSNYDMDEIERKESQKQREHRVRSTKSYVEVGNDQDNIRRIHEDEEVTNPKHYDRVGFGIQPLEYITANELDFLEGNIIKYVSRYPHKGGVNDLLKARTYLEKLIEREVEKE